MRMLHGMQHISTHSYPSHSWRRGLVIGAALAAAYVVGGGALATDLVAQGTGGTDPSAEQTSPSFMSVDVGSRRVPLTVSVVDGPTVTCLAPIGTFSADALLVTTAQLAQLSGTLDCR